MEAEKPNYINKELKKVSEEDLKKAIKEVNDKNERDRQEQREATNKALSDGFRCGPTKPHNAKRFEAGEHTEIIIQSLRDQLAAKAKENGAMRAILKELIPIVDWMRKGSVDRGLFANPGSYGKVGAALDKARDLINEKQ
jgi:hypothetical protein